jgi:CheY-like chemotaxis protein
VTKIMLVEDDNNLREIYQARLSSEGYETVTASDGEEALSIVGKEKPDLIILDVMMPKISGFDTLDLLKNSPVTKDIKVIMMTALSQAEDRARAQKLGAQNYLVKSQVTLEDIVKAIKDALDGTSKYPVSDVPPVDAPSTDSPSTPTPSVFTTTTSVDEPATTPMTTPAPTTPVPVDATMPTDNPAGVTIQPMAEPSSDPMPTSDSTPMANQPMQAPEEVVTESPPMAETISPVSDQAAMAPTPTPMADSSPVTDPASDVSIEHVDEPTPTTIEPTITPAPSSDPTSTPLSSDSDPII